MSQNCIQVSIPDREALYLLRYLFPTISFQSGRDFPAEVMYVGPGEANDLEVPLVLMESNYGIRFPGVDGIRALVANAGILSASKLERFRALESEDSVWLCKAVASLRDVNRLPPAEETGTGSMLELLDGDYSSRFTGLRAFSRPDKAVSKLMHYLTAVRDRQQLAAYKVPMRERLLSLASRLNVSDLQAYHYDLSSPSDSLLELSLSIKGR
jgi:hypothetical protein